jgi:hypothetical protein
MMPSPHRMKGGALVLSASGADDIGPFGSYGSDTGGEDCEHDQAPAGPAKPRTGPGPGGSPPRGLPASAALPGNA